MRKVLVVAFTMILGTACMNETQQAESILRQYIDRKVEPIRNYRMESEVALWNATVTGKESDYQKMIDIELNFNRMNQNTANLFLPDRFATLSQNVFTNQQDFELLRKLRDSGLIKDTLLARQLSILYQTFMGSQIETERYKKYVMREVDLWQAFQGVKMEMDGKQLESLQIDSIRKATADPHVLDRILEVYADLGRQIAPNIIQNVKERNEYALGFGYPDYYYLALDDKEQTPEQVKIMFDELEQKTREQYFAAKRVIDQILCKKLCIASNELKPWYYNDERTSYLPERFRRQMDSLFVNVDPVKLTGEFFAGIGLPIYDVIENSSLDDDPGKANLTAMVNIDFKSDIRLIAGITQSYNGMYRMMHLGGHASNYKFISDSIPYLLKTPNLLISEGIARFFENLASDADWLNLEIPLAGKVNGQVALACRHIRQVDYLFRCRRLMALAEFEREMYHNPAQDLDQLWHDVNLKYMGISYPAKKGSCYWAISRLGASLSCTIHNYVLADIFASQLKHSIEKTVFKNGKTNYTNNKAVGDFLLKTLYSTGNLFRWEELVKKATGEPLNSTYFVKELLGDDEKSDKNSNGILKAVTNKPETKQKT